MGVLAAIVMATPGILRLGYRAKQVWQWAWHGVVPEIASSLFNF